MPAQELISNPVKQGCSPAGLAHPGPASSSARASGGNPATISTCAGWIDGATASDAEAARFGRGDPGCAAGLAAKLTMGFARRLAATIRAQTA
jgi:hypothetical protein